MKRLAALLFLTLSIISFTDAAAQQGGVVTDKPTRGSEEISEYYNVNDVRNAMIIIAIAVGGVLAYLAREIILRKKTDYEKKDYASKHDRDFEKYHSEWNSDEEEFIGRKKSKESEEFRKMLQESNLPDYYATLGVASDATPREIKSKFRQLVKQYHPDKTKDETTAEKLAEINKAYEVLSDSEKRKTYDAYFKASR
ncbi:DnaJ domain-containing protein [Candidatus Nitrosotenuis cloacae]|uniref:DnaJ domain-containing protein n=1 Tax=Candidatus Nitrosotenuis cloacae TaxID=1603555 RepID=UPI00227F7E08|nr:DnaJ domain-containing protein [Candidatus Nitrosotenuis cloacae]